MNENSSSIEDARAELKKIFADSEDKRTVLRSPILKSLYGQIGQVPPEQRREYGKSINELKDEVQKWVDDWQNQQMEADVRDIDVTAPFDVNTDNKPHLLGPENGSVHPINQELQTIADIFVRMGFDVVDSRLIDDDYNMFGALNFPVGHPARDDYDTFMTEEGLVLPAHTSTMQNRVLSSFEPPIMAVIPGRVFRNEDLDATHEHTFSQVEGVVVTEDTNLAEMLGTLKTFLEAYFDEEVDYKTQPFYFPFVEPGLEFLIKTPKALSGGGHIDEWMEILGCGMIHPNVLHEAGIDSKKYRGFAWGMGVERMAMLKYGIEDVRLFNSAKLDFLKQFGAN